MALQQEFPLAPILGVRLREVDFLLEDRPVRAAYGVRWSGRLGNEILAACSNAMVEFERELFSEGER